MLRAIISRSWEGYSRLLDQRPFVTRGMTAFVIFTTSDAVRQRMEYNEGIRQRMKNNERPQALTPSSAASLSTGTALASASVDVWFDPQRSLRLSVFYAVVHAPYVHTLYAGLERVFGAGVTPGVVAKKVR